VSTIPGIEGKAWVTVLNAAESGAALLGSESSFVGRAGTFTGRLFDMTSSLMIETADFPTLEKRTERPGSPRAGILSSRRAESSTGL
jgi:hypothetical protein